jgi:two-component system KDP operon response regulator KdpE
MDTQPIRGVSSPRLGLNTIMIVQGQSTLGRTLFQKLTEQKYDVLEYREYEESLEDLKSVRIDLVIIDTTVADIGGLDLTKRIRQRSEVPIILIADKASTEDRVQGFSNGADEYITKPISDDELMARIQAIFKRQHIADRVSEPLVIGDLYVDFARRQVFIANKPVDLTRIEYDLLYHLVVNKGQVLTHKQLLEKVWGPDYANENHYLWVNISRLRKKLEKGAPGLQCIHTQQGIGYFFDM